MVNFNGTLLAKNKAIITVDNRAFRFGDALVEQLRVGNGRIYFLEEHYRRLMASMRMLRMPIPMYFTMEFLEEEVLKLGQIASESLLHAAIRISIFRSDSGQQLFSDSEDVSFLIEGEALATASYELSESPLEVELFKDFLVNPDTLSCLSTNNQLLRVVGSIYANENHYGDCFLLNQDKMVIGGLNSTIFLVQGDTITTPPLTDGCTNTVMRKTIIGQIQHEETLQLEEKSILPFALQKADEILLCDAITGIKAVSKYRKTSYSRLVAKHLNTGLNTYISSGSDLPEH